jgi:hypothetical protein
MGAVRKKRKDRHNASSKLHREEDVDKIDRRKSGESWGKTPSYHGNDHLDDDHEISLTIAPHVIKTTKKIVKHAEGYSEKLKKAPSMTKIFGSSTPVKERPPRGPPWRIWGSKTNHASGDGKVLLHHDAEADHGVSIEEGQREAGTNETTDLSGVDVEIDDTPTGHVTNPFQDIEREASSTHTGQFQV